MADQTSKNMDFFKKTWIGGVINSLWGEITKLKDTPPGSASFGTLSGVPSDNTNLQSALEAKLTKGTATAAQLDAHLANTANPHSVTKTQVGLEHIPDADSANTNDYLRRDGAWTTPPGGSGGLPRAVSAIVNTPLTISNVPGGTFADAPGLSVTITPSSTTNGILVMAHVSGENSNSSSSFGYRIMRDSTEIAPACTNIGTRYSNWRAYSNGEGNTSRQTSFTFLDQPATTSAVTYKVQVTGQAAGESVYLNRCALDSQGNSYSFRDASSITVMEVALA